jgi:hypothetical protein
LFFPLVNLTPTPIFDNTRLNLQIMEVLFLKLKNLLFIWRFSTSNVVCVVESRIGVVDLFPQSIRLKVKTFAAGYAFTVVVTDDGKVYSFGVNEAGQLGHGHRFNTHEPTLIEALREKHVVAVACGQQHCLALTADHQVYSWGLGVFGQLGHGTLRSVRLVIFH